MVEFLRVSNVEYPKDEFQVKWLRTIEAFGCTKFFKSLRGHLASFIYNNISIQVSINGNTSNLNTPRSIMSRTDIKLTQILTFYGSHLFEELRDHLPTFLRQEMKG